MGRPSRRSRELHPTILDCFERYGNNRKNSGKLIDIMGRSTEQHPERQVYKKFTFIL
jgi:hypothetical protein